MKNVGRIILIIVAVFTLHTIIDLVAIYNFNKPLFAFKGDNHKYHGLLYDTYFCPEFSAPFIKAKWNKYECVVIPKSEETKEEVKEVEKIVDKFLTEPGLMCAQALELFYSDNEFDYYFSCMKSGMIIVYYTDGTEETIKEALGKGRITLDDLNKYHIGYYKYVKDNVE